ncbi:hypothetical protein RND81_07G134500 [Saponaria officinalis]|uniref:Cysteine-rich receptor-like protein kinase 10 n=1 Tax=Saponaria officinalis TaxID=3572 RepID=A0AAW1JQN3_SAPOF
MQKQDKASLHPCITKTTFIKCVGLLILLVNFVPGDSQSHPNLVDYVCDNENGNYTDNSVYQDNLKTLLTELASQSASSSFQNSTHGVGSNKVYGLFSCRGDVSLPFCDKCVQAAAGVVFSGCPKQKEAIIWYEQCTLRYANRNFFAKPETLPWVVDNYRIANASDPNNFERVLSDTVDPLITKATVDKTSHAFATGDAALSSSLTLYCLVQCTPDLTGDDCYSCLRYAFDVSRLYDCCGGPRLRLFILRPSCQVMWDTTRFYTVKPSPPPPPPLPPSDKKDIGYYLIRAGIPAAGALALILCAIAIFALLKKRRQQNPEQHSEIQPSVIQTDRNTRDALQFDMETIRTATSNFSYAKRLGEGGFGPVYRGTLPNGQEVAVKRLSENSGQGDREFANEVNLLAKLQHKNLVRLLGFCVEGEEKLLVYEFMPNSSLDRFLFDPNNRKYLDWQTRFRIIMGISRGLLYLHEDSRLTIIHRDLKSSNVLLDEEMNPKIADFGMARLVKMDQTQANNTTRIVGTHGYMAPEYLMAGVFSIKSDVYSFGVLLLEIISGRSNSLFNKSLGRDSLLSRAWRLWNSGDVMELVDPTLGTDVSRDEVLRCIQVALFCAQEDAASRPTMASVVHMLSSNSSDFRPSAPTPSYSVTMDDNRPGSHELDEQNEPHYANNTGINYRTDLYPR